MVFCSLISQHHELVVFNWITWLYRLGGAMMVWIFVSASNDQSFFFLWVFLTFLFWGGSVFSSLVRKIDSLGICVRRFYFGEVNRLIMMICFVFWSLFWLDWFYAYDVERIGESMWFSVHWTPVTVKWLCSIGSLDCIR